MLNKLLIRENVPLAPLTTLKIGGLARFFIQAKSEAEVVKAHEFAKQNSLEIFILGGGSNILVSDKGFDGVVIQIALKGISIDNETDEKTIITAQAGEDWDEFVEYCVNKTLAGIECLSGIPGFIGGTPIQNVGAYGQEVSETVVLVRAFDRRSSGILELTNADCGFEYRTSIFNTTQKERFIVLSVTYELSKNGKPRIVYKDLSEHFGEKNPTLQETREAVKQIRSEKAMLVRQGGLDSQSAGSFFKNPVVEKETLYEIENIAKHLKLISSEENVPSFAVNEEFVKIPAAWLIEKAGFHKGFTMGNVGLSTKHTLALTNRGNATAAEILDLKNEIQKKVKEKFGVSLTPEPNYVGF